MENANTYRQYAEECRRLANSMPEHRAKLLDMAAVWTDLANKAEATRDKRKSDGAVPGATPSPGR